MHIVGTLHIEAASTETALLDRMEAELGRIEALSDEGIEALCAVIDASSASEVARKLGRFAVAAASPAVALGRALTRGPGVSARLSWQLAAYREFMERVTAGAIPRVVADELARARRAWLEGELHALAAEDEEDEDEDIDVFDAEGHIDVGAVRAEVRRLMYRLGVDPERVQVDVLDEDVPHEDDGDGGEHGDA